MEKEDKIYLAYSGALGEENQIKTQERIQWILEQAGTEKEILDIGCSQGIISILAAGQKNQVTGIDQNENNIIFAKQLLEDKYSQLQEQVSFFCTDFNNWQETKQYDCILLTEVLEHLENPEEFLKKTARLLRKNGKMIVTVPFGILMHPDHYSTFYMGNLYQLFSAVLEVDKIQFMGRWFGMTAGWKETITDPIRLNWKLILREEANFQQIDREQTEKIESYYNRLIQASQKYKDALKNYETAKGWHQSVLKKNEQLQTELQKAALKNENTEHEFKELKEEYQKQQQLIQELQLIDKKKDQIIEELQTLNSEKESMQLNFHYLIEQKEKLIQELQAILSKNIKIIEGISASSQEKELKIEELKSKLLEKEQSYQTLEKEKVQNQIQYDELNKKLSTCNQTLEKLEKDKKFLKKQYHHVIEQMKEEQKKAENAQKKTEQCTQELMNCAIELQKEEELLVEIKQSIRKLEVQNNYLMNETAEYRRKLSHITDTKLGQLGIHLYHRYHKMKNNLNKGKSKT